jgi:hypothetical protein
MHIIASALIIGASIFGASHAPVSHHRRCVEDEIQLRIHSRHGADKAVCMHVDMIAGSILRDIADQSFMTYGAGHAAIIIDDDDGEILIGRANG